MKNKIFIYLLTLLLLFATHFLWYKDWTYTYSFDNSLIIFPLLSIYILTQRGKFTRLKTTFSGLILALVVSHLLCGITKVANGESVYDERFYIVCTFALFLYYLYCARSLSEAEILKVILIVGSITGVILIWQVLSPENALFGIRTEEIEGVEGIASQRNGIYRFRLSVQPISLFCMLWSFDNFRKNRIFKNLIMFIFFTVSVYLHLTRQTIFAGVVALGCSYFFLNETKVKTWMLLFSFLLLSLIYAFAGVLFGDMLMISEEYDDTIRLFAVEYYWGQICSDPLNFILGNGHMRYLDDFQKSTNLYASDIGVIGEWFYYGIIWIGIYFYMVYLILHKYKDKLPLYIKLYTFATLLTSVLMYPLANTYEYIMWAGILYICHLYISNDTNLVSNKLINNK